MERFYFDYDDEEGKWFIMETEGGNEHGQTYDTTWCLVDSLSDARDLCRLLNKLWNNQK